MYPSEIENISEGIPCLGYVIVSVSCSDLGVLFLHLSYLSALDLSSLKDINASRRLEARVIKRSYPFEGDSVLGIATTMTSGHSSTDLPVIGPLAQTSNLHSTLLRHPDEIFMVVAPTCLTIYFGC